MPFQSIRIRPGLDAELTPLLLETGWHLGLDYGTQSMAGSNMMRFPAESHGQPEPIGGWEQLTTVSGSPRGLHSWTTLPGTIVSGSVSPLLGIGTSSNLYVYDYTTTHDITPSGFTGSTAPWILDNWGEELVGVLGQKGAVAGSPIYDWKPASGYATRAAAISAGPPAANGVIVAAPSQQMIAWGTPVPGTSSWGSTQDPMLISWSDYSNYNIWFASATNAAGSFRLTQGARIMRILPAQGQMLVFTDAALYGMQFLGGNLIYGFQQLGAGCGAIAPAAVATLAGQAFWWSANSSFYIYNGNLTPLPCPIRPFCLDQVAPNTVAASAVAASVNSKYGEIRWDFSGLSSSDANDRYVSFNVNNGTWSFGNGAGSPPVSAARNVMTDFLPTYGYPIGADDAGAIWQQEVGYAQLVGITQTPIPWVLSSGFLDLSDGENFSFVDWILPDAVQTSGINLAVFGSDYTGGNVTTYGPYSFTNQNIPLRMRGRQIAFQFSNVNNVNPWRLGRVRIRIATDGRR